jgi:hypothetical protein
MLVPVDQSLRESGPLSAVPLHISFVLVVLQGMRAQAEKLRQGGGGKEEEGGERLTQRHARILVYPVGEVKSRCRPSVSWPWYKIRPMMRGPALRLWALLAFLAFLLPLGAMADSCLDCLWMASAECCPPACCRCCVYGPSVLNASAWGGPSPVRTVLKVDPREDLSLSSDPRDIFHVPKISQA